MRKWNFGSFRWSRADPPPEFLFERTPFVSPCNPPKTSPEGYSHRLVAPISESYTAKRLEEFQYLYADLPVLAMDLDPQVQLCICGTDTDHHTVRLYADVRAKEEKELQRILDGARLVLDGGILKVKSIPTSLSGYSSINVHVSSPRTCHVHVEGRYAAIEVHDMDAGVEVSTTHARIQLIDTVGAVAAIAREWGCIVFAGKRGVVHLRCEGGGIDLKMTAQAFEGKLDASAEGPVRVLLPRGFQSGFEADVSRARNFICRADLHSEIARQKLDTRMAFRYCSPDPVLRLSSISGNVVIDNSAENSFTI